MLTGKVPISIESNISKWNWLSIMAGNFLLSRNNRYETAPQEICIWMCFGYGQPVLSDVSHAYNRKFQ